MKFKISTSASAMYSDELEELDTLEQLIQYMDNCGYPLIISRDYTDNELTLEVYNDYRE